MDITINYPDTPPPTSVDISFTVAEAKILRDLGGSVCIRHGKLVFDPLSTSILAKDPKLVADFLVTFWTRLTGLPR